MSATARFQHQFVKSAPRDLFPGVLYVSLEYCSMLHLCACGCGRKVVTPISPKDWSMTFNGASVTVHPSIGSWSLPCRSHYLIKRGKVVWAGDWTDDQISKGRAKNLGRKRGTKVETNETAKVTSTHANRVSTRRIWYPQLYRWISRLFR